MLIARVQVGLVVVWLLADSNSSMHASNTQQVAPPTTTFTATMASAAADDQEGGSFEKTGELTGRVPRPVNRPKQKHAVFRNPRYDFKLGEVVGRDMKITQSLLDMYHDRLPFLE